ncbi:hypothetical protein ACTWP5_27655 [Streptomyces sp. 4N509B]|uniref:hypothetical protein n=1 Tax=Streptomyces sp. 4N509B TaxID=3457413 RepID=UPI003FCF32EE
MTGAFVAAALDAVGWTPQQAQPRAVTADQHHRMVAIHEAGHAVIGMLAGIHIEFAETTCGRLRGGQYEGRTRMGATTVAPFEYAVVALAGRAADIRWRREHGLPDDEGSPADWKIAMAAAKTAGCRLTQVVEESDRRVARHWRQIAAVADVLHLQQRLTGADIARIAGATNPRRRSR